VLRDDMQSRKRAADALTCRRGSIAANVGGENMSEMTVRSVLRIIAVITILTGITMTTSTLFLLVGASHVMSSGLGSGVPFLTLITPVVVMGEGLLLWLTSPRLAQLIIR